MSDTAAQPTTCLHIGLPKTGTKTLQIQLFARHSQVEFLGTHIGTHREYRQCRDQQIEQLFGQLLWEGRDRPDFNGCREIYEHSVRPALQAGRVPVWSWESLMEDTHEVQRRRANNLKAVFGDCKILVGLRHPLRLVESLYLQLLKRDNVGRRASFRRGVVFTTIDQWLDKNWGRPGAPPNPHLSYAETIDIFVDVFGAHAVQVLLFEHLVENPEAYLESVCDWLNIDVQEGVQQARGKWENERWTQHQFDRLKQIKESTRQATIFRFANRRRRCRMLGLEKNAKPVGDKAQVVMSADWQRRILEKTQEGNQRLIQRWGLPLEQYGYPVLKKAA